MRNKIITCPRDVLVVSIEIGNKVKFRYKKSQQRKRKLVWEKKIQINKDLLFFFKYLTMFSIFY